MAKSLSECPVQNTLVLSWLNITTGEHNHSATTKANKASAFIYRNMKFERMPSHSPLTQSYISLVCPMLEYASVVWDLHQKNPKSDIEMVQRRAASGIFWWFHPLSMCLCPHHQTLAATAWNKKEADKIFLMYKVMNNFVSLLTLLPHQELFSPATEPPEDSSWDSKYHIPGQIIMHLSSFFPSTWNSVPFEAQTAASLDAFKSKLGGSVESVR